MELLAISLVAGGLLTLPLTLMRVSRNRWVSMPVWLFTYVVRGTPLLIQVYFIYYGIAQLEWVQALWDTVWPWTLFKDPFFCAVAAFSPARSRKHPPARSRLPRPPATANGT